MGTPVSEVTQVELTIRFMHQVELLNQSGYLHLPQFPQLEKQLWYLHILFPLPQGFPLSYQLHGLALALKPQPS